MREEVMASVDIAKLANGDLTMAAENGRLVLKGAGFYFSFGQDETTQFCRALAVCSIELSKQRILALAEDQARRIGGGAH